MPTPFTPAETAQVNLALAAANDLLDFWVRELRAQIRAHGRDQGTANTVLALKTGLSAGLQDDLLLVALLRLASPDPPAASRPPELHDGPPQP